MLTALATNGLPAMVGLAAEAHLLAEQNAVTFSCGLPQHAKIMMVDDEKLNILVVAEYLKSDGYRGLIHTLEPLKALAMIGRERPDVLLLDLHMPHLGGLALLAQIRADAGLASTAVVILTASTDDQLKSQALKLGVTEFLHKPINCAELLPACARCL